jgi:hypothetical protein
VVRGVGPDVEARLEEEGIHDVSALAYASPHQLIRATTYAPKQIADWIDEALLISTVPAHWEALERVGVTGVMDLAWYQNKIDDVKTLADEIKMPESLLKDVVTRLSQDAQVLDLYRLYWDRSDKAHPLNKPGGDAAGQPATGAARPPQAPHVTGVSLLYKFRGGMEQDARERLMGAVKTMDGVSAVNGEGVNLTVVVDAARRETVDAQLREMGEIERRIDN